MVLQGPFLLWDRGSPRLQPHIKHGALPGLPHGCPTVATPGPGNWGWLWEFFFFLTQTVGLHCRKMIELLTFYILITLNKYFLSLPNYNYMYYALTKQWHNKNDRSELQSIFFSGRGTVIKKYTCTFIAQISTLNALTFTFCFFLPALSLFVTLQAFE